MFSSTAFGAEHSKGLSSIATSIGTAAQQRLAQVPPAVPAERQVLLPADGQLEALLCPPEEVLLQQFRQEKQHIMRVGGASVRLVLRCHL